MTRIGFALLALLPWLPAPVWAQPWLPAPSAPVAAAPVPEKAPAPPAEREGERPAAEPVAAPRPGPRAEPRPAAADQAVGLAPSGLSLTASTLRLIGALAVVGILLAVGRKAARRFLVPSPRTRRSVPSGRFLRRGLPGLGRWFASAGPVEEDLAVVGRGWLGARESVCIVRSGQERFLVGVSQAGISLLARLGSKAAAPAGVAEPAEAAEPVGVALPEEPAADDFAAELAHATVPPHESPEGLEGELSRASRRGERIWGSAERSELAELLARSRERLLRLTLSSSSPHAKQRRA